MDIAILGLDATCTCVVSSMKKALIWHTHRLVHVRSRSDQRAQAMLATLQGLSDRVSAIISGLSCARIFSISSASTYSLAGTVSEHSRRYRG